MLPADIRVHDRIRARIRKRNTDNARYISIQVWKLSPLGIELVYPDDGISLRKGDPVDLELTLAGQRTSFEGLIVDLVLNNDNIKLIGIRLARRTDVNEPNLEKRASVRWICSDEFLPTCVAPTPGLFDDFMYFQIRNISREGAQLTCSLRNKFLITGIQINLTAVFPMGSVINVQVEVTRVGVSSIGGRDRLVVGVTFKSLSPAARKVIGQYLIQFSNVESLDELRKAGMAQVSLALGVDFYNLKSESDYRAVLDLRLNAHMRDGNLRANSRAQDMGDINDARARIVVGKYKNQVIATARIRFNELHEPLEHEAYLDWPRELPRRDQIIEISRVATDPRYRQNDLLAGLFRFVCYNVVQPERPWVVMSCLDNMVKYYEKIGFKTTGLKHHEPIWKEDLVLNVMIANTPEVVLGRGVNPLYWNLVWKEVSKTLLEQHSVSPNGMDKIRLVLYRALGPLTDYAIRWIGRPRRGKQP